MRPILFLLKAGFIDLKLSDKQKYYCSECVFVEGLLSFYPSLRAEIEIRYVDFEKPRTEIIEILGTDNQSCPSLIVKDALAEGMPHGFKQYGDWLFSNDAKTIAKYFNKRFSIGLEHP